ncbi:hypothetical protein [Streptomyces sp. NPDC007264]|uniref:hypothetical protein n=1 Tax=Streptomyces sp. NPDC007264 TaxID=3364777 RepID=UPI0036DBEDD2
MIKQVLHESTAPVGPAGVSLALAVTYELHTPVLRAPEPHELRAPVPRTPEVAVPVAAPVAVPQLMGLRTPATRPRRRKVPLHRLTAALG